MRCIIYKIFVFITQYQKLPKVIHKVTPKGTPTLTPKSTPKQDTSARSRLEPKQASWTPIETCRILYVER